MNAEEKLRAILRAEVDPIEPDPAGWNRIRDGVVVRRRRRVWLRGSLAAATALSLVAVITVAAVDRVDRGADGVHVTTQPPTAEPTAGPAPESVAAIGVWPLTTEAELGAWRSDPSTYPYLADIDATAERFAREYLGLDKPVLRKDQPEEQGTARYVYRAIDGSTQQVAVTKLSFWGDAPYTVLSAKGGSIDVTSISSGETTSGDGITSPLVVKGQFTGVDQPIDVTLRAAPSAGGAELATARAEIGPDGWTATLTFSTTAKTGSLLATSYSNADGGLTDAFAVPVSFGTATAPNAASAEPRPEGSYPEQFVAVEAGRVGLYNTKTGKRVRFLTERLPGGGASEPSITPDGRSVVYVQGEGTCAASIRKVSVAGGRPETLVASGPDSAPSTPVLSTQNDLAYVSVSCTNEAVRIIVQRAPSPSTSNQRVIDPGNDSIGVYGLAWSPDGESLAVVDAMTLDAPAEIYVVDPATDERVIDGMQMPRPKEPEGADCGWKGVGYTDDGTLLGAQGCWSEIADAGFWHGRLIAFDSGGPRVFLTTDHAIDGFDVDRSGDHVVFGGESCSETCEDAPVATYRFSVDGDPVKVADNLTHPAWLD